MVRSSFLGVLLVLVCVLPAQASDEEASARAFAREELIKEARNSVTDVERGVAALEAMIRNLKKDVEFADAFEPRTDQDRANLAAFRATIEDRSAFLGDPGTPDGHTQGRAGAIRESVAISDWLIGKTVSEVVILDEADAEKPPRVYAYPPPKPEPKTPAEKAPSPEKEGDEKTPAGGTPKKPDASGEAGDEPKKDDAPKKPEKPEETKPDPGPEPAWPPTMPDWARETVRVAEGGTLLQRVIDVQAPPDIAGLKALEAGEPVYVHPEVGVLHRHGLLAGPVFAYNAPLTSLRLLQADEHSKVMQADQPQVALVDSGIVREKAATAAKYRELIERHTKRIEQITIDLDEMVDDLDGWKTQAALLAGEIDALKQTLPEDIAARDPSQELELRLLQARETCVNLDLILLYIAGDRAAVRLELLKKLRRAATEESTAAESVHARYADALRTLRSTRRLDRLRNNNRRLHRWIAASKKRDPAPGSAAAKSLAAYEAMLALNDVVQDAVERRSMMTTTTGDEAPTTAEPTGGKETQGRVLSTVVREPRTASWDRKFVQLASRELEDPELREAFDAELVAEHFAVANERIARLMNAYDVSLDETKLTVEFAKAYEAAQQALAPLERDYVIQDRKLPTMLENAKEDFDAAVHGIADQREANQSLLRVLVDYRKTLRNQGTRSLFIRVERSLEDPYVGSALQDTRDALDTAGRWVSFEGESHAGAFLREAWSQILIVLVVLLAIAFLSRLGRKLVDRWIQRQVDQYPAFAEEGASVREERQRGRETREALDAAAAETSADEVLNQVREEETEAEEERR